RREKLAAERATLRRPAGAQQERDGGEIRRSAGADLAAQLRRAAAGARRRRPAPRSGRPPLRRRRRAAHRVFEGHGCARRALLGKHDAAGEPGRAPRARRCPRQFASRAGEVPGRRLRRGDRQGEHSDGRPARLRARREPEADQALLPRRPGGSGAAHGVGRHAREGQGLRLAGPPLAALLFACLALGPLIASASKEADLKALRARIEALSRQLEAQERERREARDALRASEKAISDASRALAALEAEERRMREAAARHAQEQRALEARLAERKASVGRMLRARYAAGAPDALRVALSGADPSEVARQLHYAGHVARAAAELLNGYREGI